VIPPSPAPLSDAAALLCAASILLIPFAWAGLSLINTGLGRSRSASHSMLSSLCAISVAALVYFVCGFAWQGYLGGPGHHVTLGGREWNWIADQKFLLRGIVLDGSARSLAVLFGMASVALAALIPLGTGADRWKLGAVCGSTALLAGWTYPVFAHWVWAGGYLAQLATLGGLGKGFVDAAGSSTIHAVGGLTALSIAWILGPRRGKYTRQGMPNAIPGHNSVLILLGCMLALVGWLGLNAGGSLLFAGIEPGRVVLVAVNTLLSGSAAALMGAAITGVRFGKPDASLSANSFIGGLVASCAGCAFVVPAEAVVIGGIAGTLVTFSVEWFELHLAVDDPSGAISAHAVGGAWGILSVGIFANFSGVALPGAPLASPEGGQWLAQLAGVATLIGFVLPTAYILNWLFDRLYPQRIAPEGERQGMDLYELGSGAYPEFAAHSEEFVDRSL
jgi:ammonium transporter, Amt family